MIRYAQRSIINCLDFFLVMKSCRSRRIVFLVSELFCVRRCICGLPGWCQAVCGHWLWVTTVQPFVCIVCICRIKILATVRVSSTLVLTRTVGIEGFKRSELRPGIVASALGFLFTISRQGNPSISRWALRI